MALKNLLLVAAAMPTAGLRIVPRRVVRLLRRDRAPEAPEALAAPEALPAALPVSYGGAAATAAELETIAAVSDVDDAWVRSRSPAELLPFLRASGGGDAPARLRAASAWRADWVEDADWSFDAFFAERADVFWPGDRPMMEWLAADGGAPPLADDDGAALLVLRPARHRVGAVDRDAWLRLIAWHGDRATSAWARDGDADAEALGKVSIIVDRTGSGLRNQDPVLLRYLIPPLIKNFPFALHRAYVAPVNRVFWTIWRVVRYLLPPPIRSRFRLLTGADWRRQLAAEVGPRVAARLPGNLREGGLR